MIPPLFPSVMAPDVPPLEGRDEKAPDASSVDMDNFVDLYELLNLPLSSTGSELRKSISEMYLEAQKNLDHRNREKKLFFQQLYEVHLPRARYVLLDDKRRAEYDKHVNSYRADRADRAEQLERTKPLANDENRVASQPSPDKTPHAEPQLSAIFAEEIEEIAPEVLAERRENLWEKWQVNLEAASEEKIELAALAFTPQQVAREEVRNTYMRKTAAVVRETERLRREESLRRQQLRWDEDKRTQDVERHKTEAEKRQVEAQHQQKIEAAKSARLLWSWSSGGGAFFVGAFLLFAFGGAGGSGSATVSAETLLGHRPYHSVAAPLPGKMELEDYDLGMESTAYHKKTRTINGGGDYRSGSGVFMTSTNTGHAVNRTEAGEWLDYTVNVAQSGNYDIAVLVSSPKGGGTFSVSFNQKNQTGALSVPATGSFDDFQSVEKKSVELAAGQQVMRVTFDSVSADGTVGNFDTIELRPGSVKSGGFLSQAGVLLRPLLLLILALGCFFLGRKVGESAEERVLKAK